MVVNTVEHTTKVNGIPFVIKDAKIAQCNSCGREVFSARERKRWEAELRERLGRRLRI